MIPKRIRAKNKIRKTSLNIPNMLWRGHLVVWSPRAHAKLTGTIQ